MRIGMEFKCAGIYCIYNKENGRRYIGSSVDMQKRIWRHFRALKNGNHKNQSLQNSYNLHGEEIFGILILEIITNHEALAEIEQIYIDALACCDKRFGYNIQKSTNNQKVLLQLRKSMSERLTGREFSEEHKKKIGEANKKRYNIDEEKVMKLYLEGVPAEEIYKICNISKPTLRKIRKKYGVFEPRKRVYTVKGEKHHLWGGERPKCQDCGKELSKRKYIRCVQCAGKVYERNN